MATRNLGPTMDIHTSARHLIFPHHENEIAIAEALTGKPLANYWLHSELVLVDGKNMSVDAGNNVTLKELLARGYTGREIRFMLLSVHYRKPLNFSFKRLDNIRTALRRLDEFHAPRRPQSLCGRIVGHTARILPRWPPENSQKCGLEMARVLWSAGAQRRSRNISAGLPGEPMRQGPDPSTSSG